MTEVAKRTGPVAATPRSWVASSAVSVGLRGADSGSGDAVRATSAMVRLCGAAAIVDRLWNESRDGTDGLLRMRPGEASHATRPALLALPRIPTRGAGTGRSRVCGLQQLSDQLGTAVRTAPRGPYQGCPEDMAPPAPPPSSSTSSATPTGGRSR